MNAFMDAAFLSLLSRCATPSLLQKLDGVLQEPIGILELRAVPGIGIDQQLGVRDVLCQVPGVDRGDHDVVHAVQHQRRLSDRAQAQAEAYAAYLVPLPGQNPYADLGAITQPTLVLNGVNDIMIASINSWHLAQNIPNAQLLIYPDAGHGAQFQYPDRFLKHAIQFLEE